MRLNTNAVRLADGTYLSTFHTYAGGRGYFNGFYLFEGLYPFRVLKVSAGPATTPADATARNLRNRRSGCSHDSGLLHENFDGGDG